MEKDSATQKMQVVLKHSNMIDGVKQKSIKKQIKSICKTRKLDRTDDKAIINSLQNQLNQIHKDAKWEV